MSKPKNTKKTKTKKYTAYTPEAIEYLASLDKDAFTIDDGIVYHEYSNIGYTTGSYEDTPYEDLDSLYNP